MNLVRGAFNVPGHLYSYVVGNKDADAEPLLGQQARLQPFWPAFPMHMLC